MVLFLPPSSLKHFSRRHLRLYYAFHALLVLSGLSMLVSLLVIIVVSLSVRSPFVGPEARAFTQRLKVAAGLAVGTCTFGFVTAAIGTRCIAAKNRVGLVVVADESDSEEEAEDAKQKADGNEGKGGDQKEEAEPVYYEIVEQKRR